MRIHAMVITAMLALFLVPSLFARGDDDFQPATPAELTMKSVAFAPGSPAAILKWVRRQDDRESWETEYVRMKIFRDEGKKYGDVVAEYVPGFSSIGGIKARTIRPDGTVVDFSGSIYDKLLVRVGGTKIMQKTFTLPEVQAGCIIEYRYTRRWPANLLLTTRWVVERELPVLYELFWLKPYDGGRYSSYFIYAGLPPGKVPARTGDHFELRLDDVPALEREPFAPPHKQIAPRVDYFYTSGKTEPNEFWAAEARSWADVIEGFIGDRRGIREAVVPIIAGADTADAKLRKIYARVQSIRNLSYENRKTEQEESRSKLKDNRHVEDVLDHGYGYRREINRLFVALVRAAGFEANVIRVSQRDEYFFARNLPDAAQLNGEITMVKVDGKERFFDPGTPCAPFGMLSWENTSSVGMRIARKEGGAFIETPLPPPADAAIDRKAVLHVENEVLKGTVTVSMYGQEAMVARLSGWTDDEVANRKSIEDDVKKWFPDGSTVKLTKLTGLRAPEEPLVAELDVELANLGSFVGSRMLVPMSVFQVSQKNPFASEQRKNAIYFLYPRETHDDVTIEIPDGYRVESLPQPVKMTLGAVGYDNKYMKEDRSLSFKRRFFIATLFIDHDKYNVVRSFFNQVGDADQQNIVLRKDSAAPAAKGGQ